MTDLTQLNKKEYLKMRDTVILIIDLGGSSALSSMS